MLTSLNFVSVSFAFYQKDCILLFEMIKHGYNDNMDLLPTKMSVAKIYFEIIKKNASEGVFELFVKAVST